MPDPEDRAASRAIRNVLVIARAAQDISAATLAKRIGVLPQQIDAWENAVNMPGVAKLSRWAAGLDYELALLSRGRPLTAFSPEQIEAAARAFATAVGEDWNDPGIYPHGDPEAWRASYREGAAAILAAALEVSR